MTIHGESFTLGRILARADDVARSLARGGVNPVDRVVLSAPNGPEFVAALLGTWTVGAVPALLSPRVGAMERDAVRHGIGPRAWLTTRSVSDRWAGIDPAAFGNARGMSPSGEALGSDPLHLVVEDPASGPPVSPPDDLALVKFSSGTTATPKAIALTTAQLLAEASQVVHTLGLEPGDEILAPVPLSHSYGFDLGVLPMLTAGTRLSAPEVFSPRPLLRELVMRSPRVFLGVPTIYRTLVELAGEAPPPLDRVEWLLSCTAPLHPELVERFRTIYAAPICQHYGSSETGAVANHRPEAVAGRPASVGRAMSGVRLEIVDEAGDPLPAGREGEVVAESPAVAAGYLMGGPAGGKGPRNGRFGMGDRGFLDDEGFLFITGRIDNLVNVGGLKVSPEEVERVLESHPSVREAAVRGAPDAFGGGVLEALVVVTTGVDEAGLIAWLGGRLAEHKVPRRVSFCAELPRGATGKVTWTKPGTTP